MAKLAAPKKPTAKAAPKKPTSRSKTGNSACSEAASNWQLSLRGKAALSPDTYQTLAKCRALSSTKKKADAYGRTGKLSDMGAAALAGRAEKRFNAGLITQKSRTERLNMLLKQRSERLVQLATPPPASVPKAAPAAPSPTPPRYSLGGKLAPGRGTEERKRTAEYILETRKQIAKKSKLIDRNLAKSNRTGYSSQSIAKNVSDKERFAWNLASMRQHAKKLTGTANKLSRYSLGGKLAPGRGTKDSFDVTTQRLAPTATAARVLTPMAKTPLKSTVKAVKGKLLSRAENQSGVATLRTSSIMADPERFQYKMNTSGPVGVTDQFRETKTWNKELAGVVQVWKDPSNNQTYVVNGHHRFELAQRLGVKSLNVQYIKAKDAAEARTKGALTNIAEGRGTSVDAGKFFREQGDLNNVMEDLKKRGISLSERTASEGLALARTAPKIWRDVVDEMTPVSRAVAIGKSGLRDEDQLQIYRKATEGNWRSGKTEEFATELKRAPLVKVGSASLFGDDEFVNVAEHRAALSDRFKTQLKSGKKLFGTVARSRNAGRLESAGNKIDRETSAAIAAQNDQALMAFDIERKFGSRTSRLLDRYATQIAQGDKLDRVYGGFEARATKALQRDIEKPFEQRLAKRKARLAALAR